QQRVRKLTEEYDYQRLQPQTYADYMVALLMAYEQERSRINWEEEEMEFLVTRASDWSYSKPCDEAYQKDYMRKDIRTLKSFEEYDNRFRDNFLDTGINHKINDSGYIEREFEDEAWFVKIDTLEELLEFTSKY